MGFIYLLILIAIVGVSFYVTAQALGEAEGTEGYGIWRFLIQSAFAGLPAGLVVMSGSNLTIGVYIWALIGVAIHLPYCIKLFGTQRGVLVGICSMAASFIFLVLAFLMYTKLQETIETLNKKNNGKKR